MGISFFLDYGAGAGDFCIEMVGHNLDVDYFDINKNLLDFVKWRLSKRKINAAVFDNFSTINQNYDCIVSFDVFEHLKNLPEHIRIITNKIRKGGGLIFSGAFNGGTLHLEENEKYNDFRILNNILSSNGLKFACKFAQFYFCIKL